MIGVLCIFDFLFLVFVTSEPDKGEPAQNTEHRAPHHQQPGPKIRNYWFLTPRHYDWRILEIIGFKPQGIMIDVFYKLLVLNPKAL